MNITIAGEEVTLDVEKAKAAGAITYPSRKKLGTYFRFNHGSIYQLLPTSFGRNQTVEVRLLPVLQGNHKPFPAILVQLSDSLCLDSYEWNNVTGGQPHLFQELRCYARVSGATTTTITLVPK